MFDLDQPKNTNSSTPASSANHQGDQNDLARIAASLDELREELAGRDRNGSLTLSIVIGVMMANFLTLIIIYGIARLWAAAQISHAVDSWK